MRIDNYDTLEDGGPTSFSFDQRGGSVGRRASMDWVLPDPAKHVSSHHFDVQYVNGGYWVRDVSTNGTYLQGSHYRIDGAVRLQGGERLIVGHYVIAVTLFDQQAETTPADQPQAAVDPWGVATEGDPWDLGAEVLTPVNPLPNPAANPHHLDEMAQEFVPLQRPGKPPQRQGEGGAIQQPGVQAPRDGGVQHPPQVMEQSEPPPISAPKPMPMPGLGNPLETVVQPPRRMARAEAAPSLPTADKDQATQSEAEPVSATLDMQAVLNAFCQGAGIAEDSMAGIDPLELVEALGKSARVTVDETMAMLKDRASVKQFTRGGERTMRTATGNNPMKFVPDTDEAFAALFLRPREGFLTGAEAFENALSDLRRHQTAVFAALQPALADVLKDLSPDEIEERERTSNNLLGGSKRTRNWEAYVKRWDEKASTGDHGMLDVFLRAFAKAYAKAARKTE
ncbi:type VI secretion system-associated FHA domain protein TagH [Sulfitobacter sp. F26204]|uniref:type VI secretion system-associated FHA domain protein TagH n=1 Tax=Sulfitobacter sp. F26204 TaxID=2996014 RepID=UPI00225DD50B|nr:type VI secretion system-associated FHA domain protein TagH [Sulfitobacter sp. F26204]MCX7561629.1 type VI secretion system-associated FHA domain protein TagH [Sulfitobacter sp. F26204]